MSNPSTSSQSYIGNAYDHDYSNYTEILVTNYAVNTSSKRDSNYLLLNHSSVKKKLPFFKAIKVKTTIDKSSAEFYFNYVIEELLGYDLNEPISLFLLQHFENEVYMVKILSMYK